jgi:biopolymer transport protein ExbD
MSVPAPTDILVGLRDGNWHPYDEVKGPTDSNWQPIEKHPIFAQVSLDVEEQKPPEVDDSNLDMNPLIDVCLVLLIFFILTITYATLERSIDVPEDNPDQKGPSVVDVKDIKDKIFIVTAKMDGDRVVVRIEKEEVPIGEIFGKMKQVISSTGRKQMVLDIDKDVPWGVETAILDAAKGNSVHEIMNNYKKK